MQLKKELMAKGDFGLDVSKNQVRPLLVNKGSNRDGSEKYEEPEEQDLDGAEKTRGTESLDWLLL